MPEPDPTLSIPRRAWGDAKACYRSFWFIGPAALLATVAAVGGAIVPETTDLWVKAMLAVGSAAGPPIVLGLLVLLIAFALAPGRCRRVAMDARLDRIEEAQAAAASSGSAQFTITGGSHNFNFGPADPPPRGIEIGSPSGVEIGPPTQATPTGGDEITDDAGSQPEADGAADDSPGGSS